MVYANVNATDVTVAADAVTRLMDGSRERLGDKQKPGRRLSDGDSRSEQKSDAYLSGIQIMLSHSRDTQRREWREKHRAQKFATAAAASETRRHFTNILK